MLRPVLSINRKVSLIYCLVSKERKKVGTLFERITSDINIVDCKTNRKSFSGIPDLRENLLDEGGAFRAHPILAASACRTIASDDEGTVAIAGSDARDKHSSAHALPLDYVKGRLSQDSSPMESQQIMLLHFSPSAASSAGFGTLSAIKRYVYI